ncbi:Lpg1974 family pore-forming outer membrane protein [Legionella londiniensis]|uniref:Outer membrane protein n=1 Tax=Legionella londiniensis TaxID=45068 RepID=A0A0W0VNY4_9GAMM|nr:Lpg1974 family pore-forming outer membrane protein [Legionella londiniensis]KTD21806.1 outer membrane protein [Legionella londiniensis]STX92182.1 major outer membrane protein [Legionella londiniensis]
MMQKVLATLAGLAISSLAAAGTEGAIVNVGCVPGSVTIPCEKRAWDIGVEALYLRPAYTAERARFTVGQNYREIANDWGWGFALQGSYHFRQGNDITLHWIHYDVSSDVGRFRGPVPTFGNAEFALDHLNKFDQVNLVFGQHTDFGTLKNARYYAGLQYADIRSSFNRVYNVPLPALLNGITGISAYDNADFNGVGPVIGIDYIYDLPKGLSLTANAATAVLYGTGRNQTQFAFSPTGLVPTLSYGSKQGIVPSLEAKLGLAYSIIMTNSMLNLMGGYQVVNYFNALPLLTGSSSDFGLYGPYLGLNFLSDV